ncbi:MAG: hypothetical protein JXQ75_08540, partial [Phycisphaerae bacterium]|nr:hypothetical protein [Phycisphaerae bacterium]
LEPAVEVMAELDAYDENKIVVFTIEEPELIWHATTGKAARQKVSPIVVAVERAIVPIPLLSLGVVVILGAALLVLRLTGVWHASRRLALVLSIVSIGVAVFGRNVLVVRFASPWGETVKLPDEREATDLFASLHRNVYRAFDYKTEGDIYDVLAQSVAGDLLDAVYNEVYQSLILRDQGGAVARVQSVDILDADVESSGVEPDTGDVAFRIRSRWQVHGAVYHWGHVHSRTNEYTSRYTVAQRGGQWKITGVDVLEQRRIVKEDDDPPVPPRGTLDDPV